MVDETFISDVSKEEEEEEEEDGGKSEPPATFLSALDGINTEEIAHEVLCGQ